MKKVLLMCFMLFITFILVGCQEPIKKYEDEYFIYNKKEYMNDDQIFLSGLTEKGKEQEILYIPSSFNGNKVILSNIAIISNLLQITSDSLKKVYMDAGLTSFGNFCVVNNDIKIMIVSTVLWIFVNGSCFLLLNLQLAAYSKTVSKISTSILLLMCANS